MYSEYTTLTEAGSNLWEQLNIRKRYHGYFENEFGKQAIFIYDDETKEELSIRGMRDEIELSRW